MATRPSPSRWYCPPGVVDANLSLDRRLRRYSRYMSLKVWKVVKAITELAAVVLMAYGIAEGADPTLAIIMAGAIVLGWETVEAIAASQQLNEDAIDDRQE